MAKDRQREAGRFAGRDDTGKPKLKDNLQVPAPVQEPETTSHGMPTGGRGFIDSRDKADYERWVEHNKKQIAKAEKHEREATAKAGKMFGVGSRSVAFD